MTRTTTSKFSHRRAAGLALLLGAALAGAGCQTAGRGSLPKAAVVAVEPEPVAGWRGIARPEDVARIAGLQAAWTEALETARRAGFSRRIAAEGALLQPGAAQPRGLLPPGSYRCRVIRLSAPQRRVPAFSASAPFFCHVGPEADLLAFTKQTGPERPGGYVYPEDDRRSIFLGGTATGRESMPPPYGQRDERDVAGAIERVGPFRYRLVIPRPRSGALIEVMELIPALPADSPTRVARR